MTKREKIVMNYIFSKCNNKESILLTSDELINLFPMNSGVDKIEMDEIMNNLVLDHYISLIMSDKKGKPMYCVSLDKKGESWERDKENKKKETIKLIVRTVALAILSFAVGILLKAIFS